MTDEETQEKVLAEYLPKFLAQMEAKIQRSTQKYGDFAQWSLGDLVRGLRRELSEFDREMKGTEFLTAEKCETCGHRPTKTRRNDGRVAKEALDLANLSFMIWWKANRMQAKRDAKSQSLGSV